MPLPPDVGGERNVFGLSVRLSVWPAGLVNTRHVISPYFVEEFI